MSDLLDRVRAEIRDRLELTRSAVEEYEQLEAALDALGVSAEPAPQARRPRAHRDDSRPRRPPRKRAPRGANRAALLRAIGERPGASAGELARASGVAQPAVYALLRKLTDDGEVVRRELPSGRSGYAASAPGDRAGGLSTASAPLPA
jgi:DNA-binding transcriptional ArsR family regulator